MELKIHCQCGQKLKFEVEPVNGQMPWQLNCPVCGADATEIANTAIRQTSAPAETAAAAPPAPRVRLVINKPAPPPPAADSAPTTPSQAPVSQSMARASLPTASERGAADNQMFMRGCIGAIVGGVIGLLIWYALLRWTDREFGIVAWGIGGLVGFAARLAGKQGSTLLGIICGLCAMLAIVGGRFLVVNEAWKEVAVEMEANMAQAYEEQMAQAREAVDIQNEQQARAFIAKHDYEGDASQVDAEEIQDFMTNRLPELRNMAEGKVSQDEYTREMRNIVQGIGFVAVLIGSVSLWTILWLFLGVGTAYKLGADAD